jgi:hypothetical protein
MDIIYSKCHNGVIIVPRFADELEYRKTSKYFDIEVSSIMKSNTLISQFNTSILKLPKSFDIEVSSISKLML